MFKLYSTHLCLNCTLHTYCSNAIWPLAGKDDKTQNPPPPPFTPPLPLIPRSNRFLCLRRTFSWVRRTDGDRSLLQSMLPLKGTWKVACTICSVLFWSVDLVKICWSVINVLKCVWTLGARYVNNDINNVFEPTLVQVPFVVFGSKKPRQV